MNKIKAIVFDMDGVLVDAKEWHYEALNYALDFFGYEINRFEHLEEYDGLPTRNKLQMLSYEKGLPEKLHGFINELKQIFTSREIFLKCGPSFNHQYALSKLSQEGYMLALCSNSIKDSIETMMVQSRLMDYFEFFLSNEDVEKPKPDPEIYIKAIKRLGINPKECVVLEDNKNGIKAARESGVHVFEVGSVSDVSYDRIKDFISKCEEGI